jgi:hypothetical protein
MTEQTTEEQAPEAVDPGPADNPKGTGYAVYDTQLMRYVGGVTARKPKAEDAEDLAPNGYRIVKV